MAYDSADIETRWQARWRDARVFDAEVDDSRPKFYCLEMFPYPSGYMHMGHVRNYSIGDAMARFQRLMGKNVLYPMGIRLVRNARRERCKEGRRASSHCN